MGSQNSSPRKDIMINELLGDSVLFSDFCGNIKQNRNKDYSFLKSLESLQRYPLECDVDTMEALVHLWCINCLSASNWRRLNHLLKDQLIHDFLNTLYCTSHAFDEVFLLLFSNSKSRSVILGLNDSSLLQPSDLRGIVGDILMYSSRSGLKYYSYTNGIKCQECVVDFPLKTFSLCPCTRRPLYVAMYLGRPDVVQLLLKYGARIPYEDVCHCAENSRHPLQNVMDILKLTFERKTETDDASTSFTKRNVLSIELILVDLNHCSTLWAIVWNIFKMLNGDMGNNSNIPSLKHICRSNIRRMVRNNLFLCHPHIWRILELPETLILYMNLEFYKDVNEN